MDSYLNKSCERLKPSPDMSETSVLTPRKIASLKQLNYLISARVKMQAFRFSQGHNVVQQV